MSQRTLVLVKPDGVARGLVGEVLSRIERKGFRIVALELRTIPVEVDLTRPTVNLVDVKPGDAGKISLQHRTGIDESPPLDRSIVQLSHASEQRFELALHHRALDAALEHAEAPLAQPLHRNHRRLSHPRDVFRGVPGALQVDPGDPVPEAPCREDQLLARAAVLERPLEGTVRLHVVHKTLQLGPAHRTINPLGP